MNYILLADFSVIRPDFGLFFWTSVIFILFWLLMSKFAFRPIAEALLQRQTDIQDSLDEAKKAREEMANLKAENQELLRQAQEERVAILREAKEAKDAIIAEAKTSAKAEASKIVASAKEQINNQKMAAVTDMKNQAGQMAIDIAEKMLKSELSGEAASESFVKKLISEAKLN